MFERKGQISIDATDRDEDATLEAALDAGAEDVEHDGDLFVVTTDPAGLGTVKAALESHGIPTKEAELAWVPKNTVRVEGKTAESLLKLLEELEDLDDVQKVEANFDMDVPDLAGT
jgi:transcriptional/translational regulatory protein YebC/TACO1